MSESLKLFLCLCLPSASVQGLELHLYKAYLSASPQNSFSFQIKLSLCCFCTGIRGVSVFWGCLGLWTQDLFFTDWAISPALYTLPSFLRQGRWPWIPAVFTFHTQGMPLPCHGSATIIFVHTQIFPFPSHLPPDLCFLSLYYIVVLLFLRLSYLLRKQGFICIEVPVIKALVSQSRTLSALIF